MDDSEGDPKIDQVEKYHGVNIEFDDKGYPRPSPEDLGKLNEPLFYDPIDKEDKKWEPLVDKFGVVEEYVKVNVELDDKGYPRLSPEDLDKLNEPLFYDPQDEEDEKLKLLVNEIKQAAIRLVTRISHDLGCYVGSCLVLAGASLLGFTFQKYFPYSYKIPRPRRRPTYIRYFLGLLATEFIVD